MNLLAIAVIILIFVLKNKFSRVFSIYIAIMMVFYGITQNTSYTEENGIGIVTCSYIILPILSGIWIWEAFAQKNNFNKAPKLNIWTISAFCAALFAFWNPINQETLMPDFNPVIY
jgi:disulfide bond formation protein DsbB